MKGYLIKAKAANADMPELPDSSNIQQIESS